MYFTFVISLLDHITMMGLTNIFASGIICICILIPKFVYTTPCLELSLGSCGESSSNRPWYETWYEKLNLNLDLDLDVEIDINLYRDTFTECPYIDNESERDVYIYWMEKYSKEQMKHIDILIKYLTVQRALTTEIKNYESFKQTTCSTYEFFKSKNIYSTEVDLSSQTVVFEETKTRIVETMSSVSEESELYTSLNYCKEHNVEMMPIVVGLCRSVAMSQETYISEYSSKSCTETVTTC